MLQKNKFTAFQKNYSVKSMLIDLIYLLAPKECYNKLHSQKN